MAHISALHLTILPGCDDIYVQFLVDGQDLGGMVRQSAGQHARFFYDDILPYNGGGDCQPEATVLGKPARTQGLRGAILFACGCGQSACSCVLADVSLTETTVTLHNFRVHKDRRSSLAPITFTRANFEAAIADLERQVAGWRHPPPQPPKPPILCAGRIDPEPDIHPEQEC
jgi:hypothetical protein